MNPIKAIKGFFTRTPGLLLAASAFSALLLAGFFSLGLVFESVNRGASALEESARTVAHAATAPFRDNRAAALARAEEQLAAEARIQKLQTENRQLRNRIRYNAAEHDRFQEETQSRITALENENSWKDSRIASKNALIAEVNRLRLEAEAARSNAAFRAEELAAELDQVSNDRARQAEVLKVLRYAVHEQDQARQNLLEDQQDQQFIHSQVVLSLSQQIHEIYDAYEASQEALSYSQREKNERIAELNTAGQEIFALTDRVTRLEVCVELRERQVADNNPANAEYFDGAVFAWCGN